VDIHLWVFVLSFAAVVMVATSVVTFTSWRVVSRNPVDVLGRGN